VAGPDGVGKTTLSRELTEGVLSDYPLLRLPDRPGLLPHRNGQAPARNPYQDPPLGVLASMAKALFLYVDFLLAWTFRLRPFIRRGGWVLMERGWSDLVVDPRRYGLRGGLRLLRFLGKRLPQPDLVIILEGPPKLLASRNGVLPHVELDRQIRAWRSVLPSNQRCIHLNTALPSEELVGRVAREIPAR
jgi:thymidylate kinase